MRKKNTGHHNKMENINHAAKMLKFRRRELSWAYENLFRAQDNLGKVAARVKTAEDTLNNLLSKRLKKLTIETPTMENHHQYQTRMHALPSSSSSSTSSVSSSDSEDGDYNLAKTADANKRIRVEPIPAHRKAEESNLIKQHAEPRFDRNATPTAEYNIAGNTNEIKNPNKIATLQKLSKSASSPTSGERKAATGDDKPSVLPHVAKTSQANNQNFTSATLQEKAARISSPKDSDPKVRIPSPLERKEDKSTCANSANPQSKYALTMPQKIIKSEPATFDNKARTTETTLFRETQTHTNQHLLKSKITYKTPLIDLTDFSDVENTTVEKPNRPITPEIRLTPERQQAPTEKTPQIQKQGNAAMDMKKLQKPCEQRTATIKEEPSTSTSARRATMDDLQSTENKPLIRERSRSPPKNIRKTEDQKQTSLKKKKIITEQQRSNNRERQIKRRRLQKPSPFSICTECGKPECHYKPRGTEHWSLCCACKNNWSAKTCIKDEPPYTCCVCKLRNRTPREISQREDQHQLKKQRKI